MRISSWILLVISVAAMLLVLGKGDDAANQSGLTLLGVQLFVILVSIIPTEKALRKTFDENGLRK